MTLPASEISVDSLLCSCEEQIVDVPDVLEPSDSMVLTSRGSSKFDFLRHSSCSTRRRIAASYCRQHHELKKHAKGTALCLASCVVMLSSRVCSSQIGRAVLPMPWSLTSLALFQQVSR